MKNSVSYYYNPGDDVRWYLVANRTDAVIYSDARDRKFHFVERLSNSKGKRTETELVSDKPGKGFSSAGGGSIHHGFERRLSHHELEARKFARRIGRALGEAHRDGRFHDLVLVAEPHFLGLLRESLGMPTRQAVSQEIRHEYAQGSDEQLRAQIMKAIRRD